MDERESKPTSPPRATPTPKARRPPTKSDEKRPIPCAACVGRMARGEAEACWEQASPLARACFACAKSGSQCRPVVPAGEAAAKALGDYLVVNGSNPTADGGARDPHFTRLARAAIASRTR